MAPARPTRPAARLEPSGTTQAARCVSGVANAPGSPRAGPVVAPIREIALRAPGAATASGGATRGQAVSLAIRVRGAGAARVGRVRSI